MPRTPLENLNINPDALAVEIFIRATAKAIHDIDKMPVKKKTTENVILRIDQEIHMEAVQIAHERALDPGREPWDLRRAFGRVLEDLRRSSKQESQQE